MLVDELPYHPTLIEQMGETGTHRRDSLAYMRVRVEPDARYRGGVRVFMSRATWETIESDRAAILQYYATVRLFPPGLHHLFGEDYTRAQQRYSGNLSSEAWYAPLDTN